ncbi:MAG: LamG-like jellyroll fold domain-containing protein [Bacteroidia bacterium]
MRTNLFLTAALSLCLCAASTAQTLPSYLPTDGLVGWWPFNGNANDESGNGNDGNPYGGVSITTDRFGNNNAAYNFDGLDDYIEIQSNTALNLPESYTINVWANAQEFLGQFTDEPSIVSKFGGWGSGGYAIFMGEDVGAINYCYQQGGNNRMRITNYSADTWYNITAVYDNLKTRLYIDGIFVDSLDNSGSIEPNDIPLCIGKEGQIHSNISYFKGMIDDIAIYNRALTPEEITALYTGQPVNPPTTCNPLPSNLQNGLVGYWPFCGNANDESGNGNNGTVNGATLTEDRFGNANAAYSFDGNGNYVSIADNNDLLLENTDFSISAWILPLSASNGHIFYKGFSSGNSSKYIFAMYNQSLGFHINPPSNIWIVSDSIPLGIWQLATTTKQGNLISFFRNGEFYGQQTLNYPIPNTSGVEARIGGAEPNGGGGWNGQLDDIGIWNRALSPEEVQQLYTLNACTFTVYDTVTIENVVTVYDTVLTTVTDTLIINTLITELAPPANTNTIKVFPNPAGSTLTIDYGNYALMNGYQLRIENSLGQQVFQTNINQQSDTLSLGSWGGNGLYFVHIVDPQGNTVDIRKIVLQ